MIRRVKLLLYFDTTYILLIPAIIFSIYAQIKVNSTFNKYQKINNSRGITGAEAADRILRENGIFNVRTEHIRGHLTDNYNPSDNVIRLSDSVYNKSSAAAVGVACHEAGHAIQYAQGYIPIKIRSAIIPVTQIGSSLSMPLVLLGLIFALQPLITAGIFLFTAVVFFQAVTLPVEFNASRRAVNAIKDSGILNDDEVKAVRKVLTAAALTYVAALFSSLMSLLRLIVLSNRNKR